MKLMCIAIGFFICLFAAGVWAQEPAGVEVEAFTAFMAHETLDVEDLAEGAEIQRRFYNRITPPGVELFQSMTPSVVPFDSAYFSTAFLNHLFGRAQNSVEVYPLVLVWDDKAEETHIFNAEGDLIATAPDESRDWPDGANPERVILQLDLLPVEDVEPFLYTEQRIEESLRSLPPPEEEGPARSPGSGRFQIQQIQRLTNGAIQISVTNSTTNVAEIYAYTMWYEGSNTVTTWTNDENVVVTSTSTTWRSISENVNGMQSVWDCLTNSLVLTNGAGAFADDPLPFEARVRFYAAAEYRDSDRDGLSDGLEIFTTKTDAYEPDADGDGWNDGEEINAEPPTDPFDRLSSPNPPARRVLLNAVHYSTNATEEHYVQLHSAARYPIDLSGFRLQVSNTNIFETRFTFPEETIIRPGRFILIGGSNVVGRDFTATLSLPQSYSDLPTAAIRLMPPVDGGIFPADVLFYGSHRPFNDLNLPVEGWQTLTDGTLYAGTGSQLMRRELGSDRDLRGDWTYAVIGTNPLWNSETILDSDRDGLTDGDEYSGGDNTREPTKPQNPDSDGDGLEDAFELEHGLDPNNPDTGSTGTPDGSKINPETGRTYAEDQLGYGMSVEMDTSKPDWVMGGSIGSNGWVRFDLSEVDGIGIWVTIREGGLEPEDFTFSVDGATILYAENSYVSGFRTVQCLLMPTGTNTGVTIYDGGTYWPDQTDNSLGPDIFARFQAVRLQITITDPDSETWEELPQEKVVLSDQPTRISMKFRPALPNLNVISSAWGENIQLNTSATATNGVAIPMDNGNPEFIQTASSSEIRLSFTRTQLRSAGVLPAHEEDGITERAWLDHGSDNPTESSNLADGLAFENGLAAESRGRSTNYGDLETSPPNSPLDISFFQAAGVELITAEYAGCESGKYQLMNQADYFYFSGHGSHATGVLQGGFSAADVTGYWDKDLECVIISGCSVLDINDYNNNYDGEAHTRSPGKEWEGTGPAVLLGYNYYAPNDLQNSDSIIANWAQQRTSLGDVEAWREANNNSNGRNACAIVTGTRYEYFRKTLNPINRYQWTQVNIEEW